MTRTAAVAALVSLALGLSLNAQRPLLPSPSAAIERDEGIRASLARLLAPAHITVPERLADAAHEVQELRVVWDRTAHSRSGQAGGDLQVVSRVRGGAMPRLRSLDLAEDKLFVAALDRDGVLRAWTIVPDPRIVRAEWPGPDGTLTGRTLTVERAQFLLPVPQDLAIVEVRLFAPRRDGDEFVLELAAAFPVGVE